MSPVSITISSMIDNKFIDVNNTFLKDMEYTREEVIGKTASELDIWADEEELLRVINEMKEKGEIFARILSFKSRSGKIIFGLVSMSVVKVDGQPCNLSTIINITESRKAEEELAQSEERFRSLYENVSIGIYRTTLDGHIMMANPAMVRMLGFDSFEQLAQRNLEQEGYEPDYPRSKFLEIIEKKGKVVGLESAWNRSNGETLYVRESANAVRDAQGGILYYDGTVEDITDRKKSEEALRESEDKFKYIFDHSVIGKSITLPSGEINVNRAFCEMLGYTSEEMIKTKWQEITHPDDIEITQKYLDLLLSGKKDSIRFIKRYLHKNGSVIWTDVGSAIRRDENGKPLYFMTAINDITERKHVEESLRESERRLREAQEMAHLGFWFWDVKTGYVEWSDEVFKIFWLDPKKFTPQIDSILALSPWEEENNRDKELINKAINSHSPGSYEQKFLRPDKSIGYYYSTFQGNYNEKGDVISIVGTVLDITERKVAESEIKELNEDLEGRVKQRTEQLEALNKELEAFSYSVSHDLRAPLRSIHGYTKILIEEYENKFDDEGKRICGIISTSATQMGELIDDLLNFSRIGRSSLNPLLLDMRSIVNSVFADITSAEEKSRIKLKIGKLHKASGDANLIKLVWNNLISNAIKYSSKENVSEISVSSLLKYNKITYSVKDNGVGFDMNYKHKLFGVFQRLHSESEFEGNGVGLAIVQRIILKHGGNVWAEGEIGKGATFYFSLPVNGDRQQATGDRQTKNQTPVA
jgi:PAS domain S-box-containing protein